MAHSPAATQDLTAAVAVDFGRKVASGGYGDVYKGRLTRNVDGHSGEVAVKVTRFIFTDVPETVIKGIKQELDIWKQHRHPYILPLIGVYLHQGILCAVSPWCTSGTMLQYMKSARAGHEPELAAPVADCEFDLLRLHCLEMKLLSEVAAGLAYRTDITSRMGLHSSLAVHAYNWAHGDIKASNVLVRDGVAQLGDFGFSVFLAEHSGTSSHLGTARWFAPESLQEHAHRSQEADVWAFGCVILEVRTLLFPYHRVPDAVVSLAIRKDRPFERPNDIHPSIWSIAEACWSRSPKTRVVSPTLASRIKTTLKYTALLCTALGALPDVRLLRLGYPNSNSTARFSLASVFLNRDNDKHLDLTLAVSTARNALRALESVGKQYHPAVLRPTIRLIAVTRPQLAKQLRLKLVLAPGRSGPTLRGHDRHPISVAFLPDSNRLVSSSMDQTLRIWDITTGETVIGPLEGHTNTVIGVAVHGSRIASSSFDGTFCVWEADSGKLAFGPISVPNTFYVFCIAFSRDGAYIATGGSGMCVAIWDANTGVNLREMVGHTQWITCLAFSEDGTRLVSGSWDRTVRMWDVASCECIGMPLTVHNGWVYAVCFSPDAKRIFSCSKDKTIRVMDAETRARIMALRMDDEVHAMALSPDGKRLVAGSKSGKIAMWDAQTGAAIPTPFVNHTGGVCGVAFSPDGRKIASASADMTIALWDAMDDWKRYDIDDEEVERDGESVHA